MFPPVIRVATPSAVTFTCMTTAEFSTNIYWIRHETRIVNNHKYIMTFSLDAENCSVSAVGQCVSSSTLEILDADVSDNGLYICYGTSDVENTTVTVELVVNGNMINIYKDINITLYNVLSRCWCYVI